MKALNRANDKFKEGRKSAEQFAAACNSIKTGAEQAGKGAEKGSKGLGQFASSLMRIAKYRILRTILKELAQAFREGLQNAYQFSKGVGGELAAAMDSLSVKTLTMKNQLGSAFGELLINVTPILLKIINLATRAANALAQFFAALGGRSTYLKAVDATADMSKNLSSGAGAAKELRRQLMGFDEINRLDDTSPSGGGGGGASGLDYSKMFEESPIPEWVQSLGERLQKLLPILTTIAAIIGGISLLRHIGEALGWGKAFGDVTSKIMGVAIAIAGALLVWDGFADAIENGVDWGNFGEMLAGVALLAIGLGTAFGVTGAAIGLLIGGLVLLTAGFHEWIVTGEATTPVLTAISVGIIAIGAAIALMTGTWIPLVVAAIGAAVVWIVGKWDELKLKWALMWNGILNSVIGAVNSILAWLNPVLNMIDRIAAFFGHSSNLGGYQIPNVPAPAAYATGGFPEDGLFMANHGEIVGQFSNGQTAVANNGQIIQGIERGVYNAMTSALARNGGSSEVRVYLDGRQITNAVTRNQNNMSRATGVAY